MRLENVLYEIDWIDGHITIHPFELPVIMLLLNCNQRNYV